MSVLFAILSRTGLHDFSLTEEQVLCIIVVCISLLCVFDGFMYAGRHKRYIRKAKKVYKKLNSEAFSEKQVISYVRKINPYVFEELVIYAFSLHGYGFERNRRYSGDGGIDGRVFKDGKMYLLQCKRYGKYINPRHVDAFSSVCREEGCEGFFVHTGRTGKGAKHKAIISGNVSIISGNRLVHLFSKEFIKSNI